MWQCCRVLGSSGKAFQKRGSVRFFATSDASILVIHEITGRSSAISRFCAGYHWVTSDSDEWFRKQLLDSDAGPDAAFWLSVPQNQTRGRSKREQDHTCKAGSPAKETVGLARKNGPLLFCSGSQRMLYFFNFGYPSESRRSGQGFSLLARYYFFYASLPFITRGFTK